MKILIQLNCSLDINNTNLQKLGQVEDNGNRLKRIIKGVEKFLEKKYDHDIIFVDNTIPKEKEINKDLKNLLIDNNIKIVHDFKNHYGGKNKGAGLIESWLFIKNILENYDYILYFEPRLYLENFDFINNFLEKPRNLFVYGAGNNHFFTGLFSIQSSLLINYISNFKQVKDYNRLSSIEYHIFKYIKNNSQYETLEKANVIWHDKVANKFINF